MQGMYPRYSSLNYQKVNSPTQVSPTPRILGCFQQLLACPFPAAPASLGPGWPLLGLPVPAWSCTGKKSVPHRLLRLAPLANIVLVEQSVLLCLGIIDLFHCFTAFHHVNGSKWIYWVSQLSVLFNCLNLSFLYGPLRHMIKL